MSYNEKWHKKTDKNFRITINFGFVSLSISGEVFQSEYIYLAGHHHKRNNNVVSFEQDTLEIL